MGGQFTAFVSGVNAALLGPFEKPRPLAPLALTLVLLLVLAIEWHLILDRIEV